MTEPSTRYEIRRHLHTSGMSRLVLAYDRRLRREVALKLVLDGVGDASMADLQREATILAGFNHPNVVTVHDSGVGMFDVPMAGVDLRTGQTFTTDERRNCFFIVEDYIRGFDLSTPLAMMRERPEHRKLWPRRRILKDWVLPALSGLSYAHARGIVHRDVKPKNIMVEQSTGNVVLIDFGLAKRFREPGTETRRGRTPSATAQESETLGGDIKATPWYASPEQARGDASRVDPRSDLFSFGATLYEIVTLHPPFEDRDPRVVLDRIVSEDAPSPVCEAEPVPAALAEIIRRCLKRDPAERYPNAEALRRDLVRHLIAEAPLGIHRRWAKGTTIVREGEKSDELYYLVLGRVSVEKGGREVRAVGPGEWIGFAPLAGAARSATVRATEDCEGYVFSGVTDERVLYKAIVDDPAMGVSLIRSMARPFADGSITDVQVRTP